MYTLIITSSSIVVFTLTYKTYVEVNENFKKYVQIYLESNERVEISVYEEDARQLCLFRQ